MGADTSKYEDVTSPSGMTLRCVVIFFRHGDRTPMTTFKVFDDHSYDPNNLRHFPPEMEIPIQVIGLETPRPSKDPLRLLPDGVAAAGMLTAKGRERAMGYGRSLREKYMRRLGMTVDRFVSNEIFLQAKNRQRTVDTMRCVLAGMYGMSGFYGNGGSLGNVAIIRVAGHDDDILDSKSRCSRDSRSTEPETDDVIVVGLDRLEMLRLQRLIAPPSSADPDALPRAVPGPGAMGASHPVADSLLRQARRCLEATTAGDPRAPKMSLFACSDSTISPLLGALGWDPGKRPGYLADVAFELHQDQRSNFWVRVVYKGRTIVPLQLYSVNQSHQPTGHYVTRIHYIP